MLYKTQASATKRMAAVKNQYRLLQTAMSLLQKKQKQIPSFGVGRNAKVEGIKSGVIVPTYENFLWAWASVSTRSCSFQSESKLFENLGADDRSGCMVPLFDLLNHSPQDVAACEFSKDRRGYEAKTLRGYHKGEEVLIHYGDWNNAHLVEYYGFCVQGNEMDDCVLNVGKSVRVHVRSLYAKECKTWLHTSVIRVRTYAMDICGLKEGTSGCVRVWFVY